ncbi:MAG: RelA/SpoT domain-containing protein [Proteobacteria bacterium]|nr:RelA/SpoT domain-containing protein [Pseudomonadota bacterium]
MAETGVAPQPALKTLLGLAVTGEPTGRIAAARALSNIFGIDPTAREKMPPALAAHAETMVQIADMDTIGPEDIVKAADSLFSDKTPGGGPDQPNSALLQLAKAETNAAVQTDAQSDTAAEDDAAETEVTEDTEGDENELFFDEGDNDGAADALLEEFRDFRGALLEDGIAPETPIVGSVDALTEAIARRDPDEMETRIGQLEAQLNEARTHLTDETAPVQLASLEGIGGPLMNPRLLQAWDKGLKQLDRARKFLGSLGRGLKRGDRGQRLPNPDQSNEDGVIIPRPPSAPDSSESTEDETRGIGNNQPPAIPSQFGRLNFPGNVRKFDVGSPDNRERVIFQPNNDPNRLLARARQQAPQLETDLRKITKPLPGAELAGVRVKDMDQAGFDRLQAKINRIKSPEMIPDYVGGRIYVESPSDLNRVEKILKEKFEIINRDDTLEQPRGPAGYRAVHLQVKLPDGMTAEIQLHPGIYRTFEKEARDAYVRSRSISSRGLSPAQLNELEKADSAVATKFTRAYQDWLAKGSKP